MGKANRQHRKMKEKERRHSTGRRSGEGARSADGGAGSFGDMWWVPNGQPTFEESAALEVATALRALSYGNPRGFQVAAARVTEGPSTAARSSTGTWRSTTERLLAESLRSVVCGAWDRGWQPADLVRVVTRQLSNRHGGLVCTAMADQLQRYDPSTIEPRWTSQLSDLDARPWWRPDQNPLSAWAQAQGIEWSAAVSCALELLDQVTRLPELEKLTPIPGTAPGINPQARAQGTAINERVLARIRALLAKAESSTFPPEAETFTAGAQALMARHSIDHALLAALGQRSSAQPTGRRIGIDSPYEAPKTMLLAAVAEANRCRTVWSRDLGFCTAIGFPADLDAVELLFTSLLVQATGAMLQAGARTDGSGRSRTRSFRQSFLTGYASRIGQRLSETTEKQTAKAASEPSGRNLLPVLAARNEAVDEAVTAMFPRMTSRAMGAVTHREGWFSGLSAADRAALHVGEELAE